MSDICHSILDKHSLYLIMVVQYIKTYFLNLNKLDASCSAAIYYSLSYNIYPYAWQQCIMLYIHDQSHTSFQPYLPNQRTLQFITLNTNTVMLLIGVWFVKKNK